MALYFQPTPIRIDGGSLPSAPDSGLDTTAIIDELIRRIEQAERKIEFKVDNNSLAKIIATDTDIAIVGDQVSILGQLTIADWVRDLSGNLTGGIDKTSLTRITGGKIQTGIIESVNWSTTQGSQFNLNDGTIVTGGSVSPKFSVTADGTLTAQNAIIQGTLQAGSIITNSVTISGTGTTMQQLVDGMGGSSFDLQAALDAGVTNIIAGIGTDFRLDVDTANALVSFRHVDAVPFGNAGAGGIRPAIGLTAAGIAMGFNDASGAWINGVAIDATGLIKIKGELQAATGTFSGTLQAGSIIADSVTVDGVTLGSIKTNAINGNAAAADTFNFRVSGAPSNLPVIGSITTSSSPTGGVDITLNWTYTQGTNKAERFVIFYNEGVTNPTTASAILSVTDGNARSVRITSAAMDKSYKFGIVADRTSAFGQASTAIVNAWTRTGTTANITANIDGTPTSGVKNTAITLGSTGILSGAGGGSITNLDYSNVGGTKPPANATQNIFSTSTSNPSGGVTGDAHWNSSTSVMWFNTAGVWKAGGTVSASAITTGTLAAARIQANSLNANKITSGTITATQIAANAITATQILAGAVTSSKISVTTLAAITANLGAVNAGSITGSAGINITGQAKFNGLSTGGDFSASVQGNPNKIGGRTGFAGFGSGSGQRGVYGSGTSGAEGGFFTSDSSAPGLKCQNTGTGFGLSISNGGMSVSGTASFSSTISGSITGNSGSTSFVSGSNVSGAVASATNSTKLDSISSAGWCRLIVGNTGTAFAAGSGFQLNSELTGIEIAGGAGFGNRLAVRNISDRRLKQNIKPEILGADFVHKMASITKSFEYKERPGKVTHGWIAQDVAVIKPTPEDYMSHTHENGIMGVDYNGLISILYYNLSAALRRIDALESKTRIN